MSDSEFGAKVSRDILCGDLLFYQLVSGDIGLALDIMKFEQTTADEVAGSVNEDLQVFLAENGRGEELILGEDVAHAVSFTSPLVKSVTDQVSLRIGG